MSSARAKEIIQRDCDDALRAMLDLILSGRHYQTQNPYTRPEVKQALRAPGETIDSYVMRNPSHEAGL